MPTAAIAEAVRSAASGGLPADGAVPVMVRPTPAATTLSDTARDVLLPRTKHGAVMVQLLLMAFNEVTAS